MRQATCKVIVAMAAATVASGLIPVVASGGKALAGEVPVMGDASAGLEGIDSLFLQAFESPLTRVTGMNVVLAYKGRVVYDKSFGWADIARTAPLKQNALMRVASNSKTFTAGAVHDLVRKGQLSYDTKLFNIDGNGGILNIDPYPGTTCGPLYYGSYGDPRYKDITVGHALSMTAGWTEITEYGAHLVDVPISRDLGLSGPPGKALADSYLVSQRLARVPGTEVEYVDAGHNFLGNVVEQLSGKGLIEYVHENITRDLGIPDRELVQGRTRRIDANPREPEYDASPESLTPDAFWGYESSIFDPNGPLTNAWDAFDTERATGFGGMLSSAKAMALYASRMNVDALSGFFNVGRPLSEAPSVGITGFTGSVPGCDSLMAQTDEGLTISVVCNGDTSVYPYWAWDFFVAELPDLLASFDFESLVGLSYAGDFDNDQWLTEKDISLFIRAIDLGEEAFALAYPEAIYLSGDFDGDGVVTYSDIDGFRTALVYAGLPSSSIPEPAGTAAFAISMLMLLSSRARRVSRPGAASRHIHGGF